MERLGREFVRRGMHGHALRLRLYYLALRRRLLTGGNKLEVHWSEELVVEWLKTLRLSPYRDVYPVRPAGAACARCKEEPGRHPSVRTDLVFPGGARMRCDRCGDSWVVDEV